MSALLSFVARRKNRRILSWAGGGLMLAAGGLWSVITYIWPAYEPAKIICAQGGSVAAGGNASGNIITYSSTVTADSGTIVKSCDQVDKK
jgi:hypothetical protein